MILILEVLILRKILCLSQGIIRTHKVKWLRQGCGEIKNLKLIRRPKMKKLTIVIGVFIFIAGLFYAIGIFTVVARLVYTGLLLR